MAVEPGDKQKSAKLADGDNGLPDPGSNDSPAASSSSSSAASSTPVRSKKGGFWSRFLRKGPELTAEELDRQAFEQMRKHREKERSEFYSAQQLVNNRQKRPKDFSDPSSDPTRSTEMKAAASSPLAVATAPTAAHGGTSPRTPHHLHQQPPHSSPVRAGAAAAAEAPPAPPGRPKIIVFQSIEELPEDVQASIERMKVPYEELLAHRGVLANILSFDDRVKPKRRFYTVEQKAEIDAPGYSKDKANNRHKPRMLTPPEKLFREVPVREVKKIFKISDFLGEGGFGDVVKARVLQKSMYPGVAHVAIKYQDGKDKFDRMLVAQEASFLQYCNHPAIVKLYDCLQIQSEIWIVCELLEGGTLKEAAESSSTWSEAEIAYVASKMLRGLRYLHKNQLAHRDLKNLNVMFTIHAEVKLIDFGLCADLSKGPTISMVGSPFWMAPEMIRGDFHSYPVDIWSFMVCMLELANRRPPDSRNVKRALFQHAIHGLGPDAGLEQRANWSEDFFQFLSAGEHMNPDERSTAKELLRHPFLQQATTREHMTKILSQIFTLKTLAISGI